MKVTAGDAFTVKVGEGMSFNPVRAWSYGGGATGGGGGGNGATTVTQRTGGSGGGGSSVWSDTGEVLAVAGGGGGGNSRYTSSELPRRGGPGGGLAGLQGAGDGTLPTGGTQCEGGTKGSALDAIAISSGRAEHGFAWKGGRATGYVGLDCSYGCGGGGGGGYYGGGGGSGGDSGTNAQGGAGGSSYVKSSAFDSYEFFDGAHVHANSDQGGVAGNAGSSYRTGDEGDGGNGLSQHIGETGKHGLVVFVY